MSDPFVGEIKIVGFNFAPSGFAACNGQVLNIQQNTTLFAILGTTYGGNGTSTFALPNLQNSAPMNMGAGLGLTPRTLGEQDGTASVTLTYSQMPAHVHQLNAALLSAPNAAQNTPTPGASAMLGTSNPGQVYSDAPSGQVHMAEQMIGLTGGSLPHENRQPFIVLNFVIALYGIFPARN